MRTNINMRDVKRIDKILKLIGDNWKKHPDYRFGQLLINMGICDDSMRLWHTDDNELGKYLEELNAMKDK